MGGVEFEKMVFARSCKGQIVTNLATNVKGDWDLVFRRLSRDMSKAKQSFYARDQFLDSRAKDVWGITIA
jgi:hypothetical protein